MPPAARARDQQWRQHDQVHQREQAGGERHQHRRERHVVVVQRLDGVPQRGGVAVAAAVHLGDRERIGDDVDDQPGDHQRQQHRQPFGLVAVELDAAAGAARLFIQRDDFVPVQRVAVLAGDPRVGVAGQRFGDRRGARIGRRARCEARHGPGQGSAPGGRQRKGQSHVEPLHRLVAIRQAKRTRRPHRSAHYTYKLECISGGDGVSSRIGCRWTMQEVRHAGTGAQGAAPARAPE